MIIVKLIKGIGGIIKNKRNKIKRYWTNILWILHHDAQIAEIELETINRCNGLCSFCPVNANEKQRDYAKMSEELFHKIIDELATMKYEGKISLFSNNEPFLDERIVDFHKYAYEKLPNVKHCLYTNGTLLTLDKFLQIIPYLDYMHIDNYNDEQKVNDNLVEVYNYLQKHDELSNKVVFDFRLQNQVLTSRGGQAPNKNVGEKVRERCLLPYRMLIIRPDGKVSLCCNDALGKYTLGDLNKQSITEVWNSEEYKRIRKKMLVRGRKMPLCNNCDTKTEPF